MKKIKMLTDAVNKTYGFMKKGEIYEVSNDSANDLLKGRVAKNVDK